MGQTYIYFYSGEDLNSDLLVESPARLTTRLPCAQLNDISFFISSLSRSALHKNLPLCLLIRVYEYAKLFTETREVRFLEEPMIHSYTSFTCDSPVGNHNTIFYLILTKRTIRLSINSLGCLTSGLGESIIIMP